MHSPTWTPWGQTEDAFEAPKPANDSFCDRVLGAPGTTAREIAAKAADLVGGDRDRQHGQKEDNFARIASVWNAYLDIRRVNREPLSAIDVGHMMSLMKIARTQSGSLNIDDYVDGAGYLACAGEIAASRAA